MLQRCHLLNVTGKAVDGRSVEQIPAASVPARFIALITACFLLIDVHGDVVRLAAVRMKTVPDCHEEISYTPILTGITSKNFNRASNAPRRILVKTTNAMPGIRRSDHDAHSQPWPQRLTPAASSKTSSDDSARSTRRRSSPIAAVIGALA